MGERLPYKQDVIGSSPIVSTKLFGGIAQLGERLPYKQDVIGSSPIVSTKSKKRAHSVPFFHAFILFLNPYPVFLYYLP